MCMKRRFSSSAVIVFAILTIVNSCHHQGFRAYRRSGGAVHLDAMPGKQMAIDADMSSGLIDEMEARRRRKELEDESNFFGSMDGSAKFVRGDAIAGPRSLLYQTSSAALTIGAFPPINMPVLAAGRLLRPLTVGERPCSTPDSRPLLFPAPDFWFQKGQARPVTDKALFKHWSGYPSALGLTSAC